MLTLKFSPPASLRLAASSSSLAVASAVCVYKSDTCLIMRCRSPWEYEFMPSCGRLGPVDCIADQQRTMSYVVKSHRLSTITSSMPCATVTRTRWRYSLRLTAEAQRTCLSMLQRGWQYDRSADPLRVSHASSYARRATLSGVSKCSIKQNCRKLSRQGRNSDIPLIPALATCDSTGMLNNL